MKTDLPFWAEGQCFFGKFFQYEINHLKEVLFIDKSKNLREIL